MNLVNVFQDFKRIYGLCPCCGEPFRLSDAILFTRKAPPRTEFENLGTEWKKVEAGRQRLDDQRGALREKARLKGRVAAQERLQLFQPFFSKQKLNVRDVKVLFDPVDYLAFRGIGEGDCREVMFIDHEPDSS